MASEPCISVSPTVKRIQWLSDDRRKALRSEVARELRGRSDEEKWRFTYRRLFPDVSLDNIPSPCKFLEPKSDIHGLTFLVFQDPVISIVSFVVDHYEMRLRSEIRESNDLSDLEGRVPAILEDFLAQYGVATNPRIQLPITPSISCALGSISAVEPASQPILDPSSLSNGYNWDDFQIPEGGMYGAWAPLHDEANPIEYQDGMLDFTNLGGNILGSTSASHPHDLLQGVQ